MYVWEMTQAEFVGKPEYPGAEKEPGPDEPWSSYQPAMEDEDPDLSKKRCLTGRNSGFRLCPLLSDPKSFRVDDMTQGSPRLVAFYKEHFLLVDRPYRKQWLAEELILEAENVRGVGRGKTRNLNRSSVNAFRRAHELAVRRAHAALEDISLENLVQYGLRRL